MKTMHRKTAAVLLALLANVSGTPARAADSGDASPNCTLNSIDGARAFDLGEFKGKVVYLDFWASWCGPCAKSFPFMNALHHELGGKGLQIVGVNLDENPEDAKTFLQQNPVDFTIAADKEEQCARKYDVKAMPSSVLIGRDGVIHHVQMGFRADEANELKAQVEKLLTETPNAEHAKP